MPIVSGGNQITSTNQVGNEVIENADIAAGAAIALSKLATNPLARANHTGQQTASTISDFNSAVQSAVTSSYPSQQLDLIAGTSVNTVLRETSNNDGSVKVVATHITNTITLTKFAKDVSTGHYKKTHQTTLALSGGQGLSSISIVGSYIYVGGTTAGAAFVRRYDLADLANVTTITVSGTNSFDTGGAAFGDGTYIYQYASANTFRKYSIAGTTITDAGTITYTSSGTALSGAICDGVNVWITDSSGGAVNIRKYALAGGAVVSTTTFTLTITTKPNAYGMSLTFGSSSVLLVGYIHTVESNSAVVGTELTFKAITLP